MRRFNAQCMMWRKSEIPTNISRLSYFLIVFLWCGIKRFIKNKCKNSYITKEKFEGWCRVIERDFQKGEPCSTTIKSFSINHRLDKAGFGARQSKCFHDILGKHNSLVHAFAMSGNGISRRKKVIFNRLLLKSSMCWPANISFHWITSVFDVHRWKTVMRIF